MLYLHFKESSSVNKIPIFSNPSTLEYIILIVSLDNGVYCELHNVSYYQVPFNYYY